MNAASKNRRKEDVSVPADSDEDFKDEDVSLGDELSLTEGEEDLETTLKAIQGRAEANSRAVPWTNITPSTHQPTVVDFIRNFLVRKGMKETLNCFQAEMSRNGMLDAEHAELIPGVYLENQRLESELKNARRENEEHRLGASVAADTLVKIQKARDVHQLQHKRVAQEKNRLIEEMKKLKLQCDSYEPALKRMHEKYQKVSKQVMLITLERDKALRQLNRQSDQQDSSLCGGEEGHVDGTSVKKTSQARPPAAQGHPKRQSRVQKVKQKAP